MKTTAWSAEVYIGDAIARFRHIAGESTFPFTRFPA